MNHAVNTATDSNTSFSRRSEMSLAIALLGVLIVLLIPLPTVLLDLLLAANLSLTILLLLVTLSARQPLEISSFPSLLLLMTLFRLSLNVATTRLILLDGDAGRIVSTFGNFVVGGNLVVGLVIFLILIIIQFIVITKGAGRVSEVAARFTLDAMPGKQMAIDAELNSGAIDDKEARGRRQHLTREAEFYGAMDGASKFVRGDAIAGLIITAINLVGGVVVGVLAGNSLGKSLETFSILTVGDGLISQIPALIIATTAGILTTKAASDVTLGHEIGSQLLTNRRPLIFASAILAIVGLTPGLPKLPFFGLALLLLAYARKIPKEETQEAKKSEATPEERSRQREEQQLNDFLDTDRACVEIGAQLIPMVEPKRGRGLSDRIATMRTDLTRKYGLWIPTIRIRDNLQVESTTYRLLVGGREVAQGSIQPDMWLAIKPERTSIELRGEDTREPAFGLPAKWIGVAEKQRAEIGGYTVVDSPSVLITHLGEVLRRYAHELLGRDDVKKLIDRLRTSSPALVDEIKPDGIRMTTVHQVLKGLLEEQVPVTNLPGILESIVTHASQIKDPADLCERVRVDIGRSICDAIRNDAGKVRVIVLEPQLEAALRDALNEKTLALHPSQLEKLIGKLGELWKRLTLEGQEAALLSDQLLRRPLRRAIERALPDLRVIAYTEIPKDLLIDAEAVIHIQDVLPRTAEDSQNAPPATPITPELTDLAQFAAV
jgi:flagellar biosynthesis protein FlhA